MPRATSTSTRGVLGLRMVKKTVNQDDPTVYHLFYADEQGSPGRRPDVLRVPGRRPGRAGDGMVHRIVWRVGSPEALDFWAERLAEGVETERADDGLRFADPEGLEHELVVADVADAPLSPTTPRSRASTRCRASTASAPTRADPARSEALLRETLGFAGRRGRRRWEVRGDERGGLYAYDPPPAGAGLQGAGTRPPHRVGDADGRARGVARARRAGRARARRR